MSKEVTACKHTLEIICPHCGYRYRGWAEKDLHNDGDENELQCSDCGEYFIVELHLSVTYSTRKRAEG